MVPLKPKHKPMLETKMLQMQEQYEQIVFNKQLLDNNPPSFQQVMFPEANLPNLPLTVNILKKIKQARIIQNISKPLSVTLDASPSQTWFSILSEPEIHNRLPKMIAIPKPIPIYKSKLAILYPVNEQFNKICDVLKNNLQPQQYTVTNIGFKSEYQLEEYSKNNGQKLNGYDKIVVFLSHAYRKYDQNLQIMKSKLNNRMEYFILQDDFQVKGHPTLKNHLKPYKIRKAPLPHKGEVPRLLNVMQKVLIMAPYPIIKKYQTLRTTNVSVEPYTSQRDVLTQLHVPNQFLIIISSAEDYHAFKAYPKSSPRCALLIDTDKPLPEDELYLFRINSSTVYYGNDGPTWLRTVLPGRGGPGEETRVLFYRPGEEEAVFGGDYKDYEKVGFRQWKQLYLLLIKPYLFCSNWLIKSSPGKPEIVSLIPKVYMEDKVYMRQFKNNFANGGYLNGEKVPRKSSIILHEFAELPEVMYSDQKQLTRYLQKQQAPSVILFDSGNVRVGSMRNKWSRHKWIGLTNAEERWIDWQGNLLEVTDERLKRKQDMFANMFNWKVFDDWNDMQYYYLSNKANVDHNRNIYFRTKQSLMETYTKSPNLLMVIFVEAKDLSFVPQALYKQGSQQDGRVKLILLEKDFIDDYHTLYIKFNEIDPVINHINALEKAGRIDFIVYNESDGERTRQTLIQRKKMEKVQSKPYKDLAEVEDIAKAIKGKFKQVYVVCFPDQEEHIKKIFNSYSIKDKGIQGEGVQFHRIDRQSFIKPNPSHLSQLRYSPEKNNKALFDKGEDGLYEAVDHASDAPEPNIKSTLKIKNIIHSKNFVLSIHQKFKNIFPVGNFFAKKIQYFSDINAIAKPKNGVPRLVISGQKFQELHDKVASSPETLVVFVTNDGRIVSGSSTMVVLREEEMPKLIETLQNNGGGDKVEGSDDDSNSINILDEYNLVRVVYDNGIDSESKRKLLSASKRNHKIIPTKYKGIQKIRQYLKEPGLLLLLLMSYIPEYLDAEARSQNYVVVKKNKLRAIVPFEEEENVDGLETILEEEEGDNENQTYRNLSDEQVDLYLKIHENNLPQEWPKFLSKEKEEGWDNADGDNVTKLNVHSNIQPKDLFNYEQIEKIKQRLTGDRIVVMVLKGKEKQYEFLLNRFNILFQQYNHSLGLQNHIRELKDNVTLVIIDRNMVENVISLKKKYPYVTFILDSDTPQQDLLEQNKLYIAGQIKKVADFERIIGEIYGENERIRYNADNIKMASRFEVKKTSIVDSSNNQRFNHGLNNQKSKKAFLFYRDPENNHVKSKLIKTFNSVTYVPYKSVANLKEQIDNHKIYTGIIIANGEEIPEIEDYVVNKKSEKIYVIRFNPPSGFRDNLKVKKLLSTHSKNILEDFIYQEFSRIYNSNLPDNSLESKYKSVKNIEGKRYTQKYEPNGLGGGTPRFPAGEFIPPKHMGSQYSRKITKSTSRSKMLSQRQLQTEKLVPHNMDYFQN